MSNDKRESKMFMDFILNRDDAKKVKEDFNEKKRKMACKLK